MRYMIENPKKIEATMKITMKVKEWELLRDQLQNKWPSSPLTSVITQLLIDARKVIYGPEKDALFGEG